MSGPEYPSAPKMVALRPAWMLTSATNILLGLVAFVAAPLAARILGPEGRGRLVAIQLVPQILADLSAIGLGFAIIHFGARHPLSVGRLIRWSMWPVTVGSLVMMAIGNLIAGSIAGGDPHDERLMRWYLLLCPITAVTIVMLESLRAMGDFRNWNLFVLLRGISWPVALVVGLVGSSGALGAVVAAHLALSMGLLVILGWLAWSKSRRCAELPPVSPQTYVRYGMVSAVSTIPRSANAKLDQIVMTLVVSRDNLGLYAAAVGWSALTVPVLRGLTSITMPHISASEGEEAARRTRHIITLGVIAVLLLSVGGIAVTLLLWGPVYGPEFRPALTAAVVLIPAALLLEFNAVLGNVLRSLDRPGAVALLESGVMVVSTAALLAVLPIDEVLGPAWVSLVAYGLGCLLYSLFIARQLEIPLARLLDWSHVGTLAGKVNRRFGDRQYD
jgi:enterobacterial common antigen flippase